MTGRIRGEAGPEVFVPTTDRGEQGPGAVTTSPGLYDPAELEALFRAVWSLDGDEDPTRFDELLHAALVFLGRLAVAPDGTYVTSTPTGRADMALLLRRMELRATLGPDHPVRQP